ncbi:hypothetical protein TanjilG_20294 [Lupinus angustifolius]|uniref:Uncharacterized protein n=1 Tax=Lupinus angustifolius TaxID=3871 RepID=A0A1J7HKJ8_LUPAN|nr:hypothetical protein TanjilG_20294 [Lupinus angustifolius]
MKEDKILEDTPLMIQSAIALEMAATMSMESSSYIELMSLALFIGRPETCADGQMLESSNVVHI